MVGLSLTKTTIIPKRYSFFFGSQMFVSPFVFLFISKISAEAKGQFSKLHQEKKRT